MKDGIKVFSELKTNEFLSYISDKIWLKCFTCLAEILKNQILLQRKVTNMIQLRNKSPSIVFEFAKLASSSNGRKRYYA